MAELRPNEGKNEIIEVDGISYRRLPIKTHIITDQDKIEDVAEKYAKDIMEEGDVLFISEKCVACTQKRAIPMEEIKPRPLAKLLCKFVYKSPYGIGLSIPQTMEMALQECGTVKILWAAFCRWAWVGEQQAFPHGAELHGSSTQVGKRGIFYDIAGPKARSIDGPCDCTIPPYNHYVVLGPVEPDKVAVQIKERIGFDVCIVDINDIDGVILGVSDQKMDRDLYARILKDNPLGQSGQQTPMGIIRK